MTVSPKEQQKNWKIHTANLSLLILVIVALYWRVFFLGQTIIDVSTLNNQLPWGCSAAEADHYPYNRRDPTDMYLTREYFIAQAYRDGEMPLWNPYTMCGHPIYADGVTRIFSPSLLFYTFLDYPLGYSVARLVELMLGALFMYLFLIAIGVSPRGALAGSLIFELSAHSLFHLTGLGWWGGLLWLPLIFLFVDRAITRSSYTQAIIAGIFLAAQLFCAYMPNEIYYLGAIILYYTLFGLRAKNSIAPAKTRQILAMLAITLAVGLLLAATQWLPVMELLHYSNRRIVPTEAGYIYLPPWYIFTLVFPNLFGTAYDPTAINLFTALHVSHDHSLYLGIASLLPLGFFISSLKRRIRWFRNGRAGEAAVNGQAQNASVQHQRTIFFLLLAGFALFIIMGAPLYIYLTRFIPVLQTIRVIVRAGVLFLFAAAVLVGFGMDDLLQANKENLSGFLRYARSFFTTALGLIAFGVLVSYLLKLAGFANGSVEYLAGTGWRAYLKSVVGFMACQFAPPQMTVILPLVWLATVYLLLRFFAMGRLREKSFFSLLVILLISDLFLNSLQFDQTHNAAHVFPKTEITEKLRTMPPARVLVTPSGIDTNRQNNTEKIIAPPNTLLAYQISTLTGKDQLFPKSYQQFCSLIESQNHLSHVVFDKSASPFFDLLNARYVMTYEAAPPPKDSELIMKAEGLALYENKKAMPRAFFVKRVMPSGSDSQSSLAALNHPEFDVRTEAVVQGVPSEERIFSTGNANMIEEKRNRVAIETENEGEGWLILSDNFYPGWQATVDGKPAEIFPANLTMRGVHVPAGRHMVSFTFVPQVFRASAYISLASAFAVLIAVIFMRKRRENR